MSAPPPANGVAADADRQPRPGPDLHAAAGSVSGDHLGASLGARLAAASLSDETTTSPTRPPTPSTASAVPAASFPGFACLPAELRIKIWQFSFVPRVVEVHRPKSHYADDYHIDPSVAASRRQWPPMPSGAPPGTPPAAMLAKWQSCSANPAALAVSSEARACALRHYTAVIRLAANTACERLAEVRLDQHRRLYLAPQADTLAVLGEFSVPQTVELLRHIAVQGRRPRGRKSSSSSNSSTANKQQWAGVDPELASADVNGGSGVRGLRRLALSAAFIGYPGSGILLLIYGRTIFQDLEQLVLFLYDDHKPPEDWHDGHCALVDCRDTYQFRRFQVGRGAELRSSRDRGWITVGQHPIDVLDLAFGQEATDRSRAAAAAEAAIATTTVAATLDPSAGSTAAADDTGLSVKQQHATTVSVAEDVP